jgi:hypothetical protein
VAREGEWGLYRGGIGGHQRVGNARGSYSGDVTGRGRERGGGGDDDRWGPHVSEEGSELGTGSGSAGMGRGLASGAGLNRFPGVQNVFIRFASFLFSFLDFYLSFENALSFRFE